MKRLDLRTAYAIKVINRRFLSQLRNMLNQTQQLVSNAIDSPTSFSLKLDWRDDKCFFAIHLGNENVSNHLFNR